MNRERGAVGVVVALLMVAVVGFAAIAVDAGALWMDRKELQNGADAAALALAQSCAAGSCESTASGRTMATRYAQGNKRDANVTVTDIIYDPPGFPAPSVKVKVSSTRQHWFAPIFGSDSSSSLVGAEATVAWGGIGSAPVSPFTVSLCHLTDVVAGTTVKLIIKGDKVDCIAGNPPHSVPGGMNWLDTNGTPDCTVALSIDNWAAGSPGNDGPNNSSCNSLLTGLIGQEITIPIFDNAASTGSGASYHIVAFAVLKVSSYCLSKPNNWYGGSGEQCTGSERFVTGSFIKKVNVAGTMGGPDYGARAFSLIG